MRRITQPRLHASLNILMAALSLLCYLSVTEFVGVSPFEAHEETTGGGVHHFLPEGEITVSGREISVPQKIV